MSDFVKENDFESLHRKTRSQGIRTGEQALLRNQRGPWLEITAFVWYDIRLQCCKFGNIKLLEDIKIHS